MTFVFGLVLGLIAGVTAVLLHGARVRRDARTALLRCEEELRYVRRQGVLGDSAVVIADEANHLVTAIEGVAGMLARKPLEPNAARLVQSISKMAKRTRVLARCVLEESRRRQREPRLLDMGAMVQEMEAALLSALGDGIAYTSLVAPNLPMVSASRMDIERILMTWIRTARDSMPAGGTLAIELAPANEPWPAAHAAPQLATSVGLTVRDAGCGFDRQTLAHLFDPDFTAQRTHDGVSFHFVKELVERNGGTIELTSMPGAGTSVRMQFPAAIAGMKAPRRG